MLQLQNKQGSVRTFLKTQRTGKSPYKIGKAEAYKILDKFSKN